MPALRTADALRTFIDAGKARYVGASTYTGTALAELASALARRCRSPARSATTCPTVGGSNRASSRVGVGGRHHGLRIARVRPAHRYHHPVDHLRHVGPAGVVQLDAVAAGSEPAGIAAIVRTGRAFFIAVHHSISRLGDWMITFQIYGGTFGRYRQCLEVLTGSALMQVE